MELWSGKLSDYNSLRVFSWLAYAHVRKDKLDARVVKCYFIGYPEGVKGYKLWSLETTGPRVIISRDVTFDETKMTSMVKYDKEKVHNFLEDTLVKVDLPDEAIEDGQSPENTVVEGEASSQPGSRVDDLQTRLGLEDYQLTRDR